MFQATATFTCKPETQRGGFHVLTNCIPPVTMVSLAAVMEGSFHGRGASAQQGPKGQLSVTSGTNRTPPFLFA